MQSHMSSASLPEPGGGALPKITRSPGQGPEIVPPAPRRPRTRALGWAAAAVVAALVAGLYLNQDRLAPKKESGATPPGTALATVVTGNLERTIRLTGTVSAERFAALMVPNLRGSRTGRGREGGRSGGGGASGGSGSSGSSSSSSSSSTSSGSSSSSTASASSASSGSGGTASSSTNTATNAVAGEGATSLGAVRGTSNRFTDRSSGRSSGGSGSGSGSRTTSSSMGSSGLGSTGDSLGAGRGGGGGTTTIIVSGGGGGGMMISGGGDFMMVLLSVAPPGSHVKKGDVVAEFDRQFQLNRLDDYRASVVQADANLRKLKADLAVRKEAHQQSLRVAKANLDRATLDLKTLDVVSEIDKQRLTLAHEEAQARQKQLLSEVALLEVSQKADLRVGEIELSQAKIELQRAETNIERMVVKAPIDGIVVMQTIRRGMEQGQIQQGDQVYPGMTFMQIVDPSSMVVNANVNQVDSEALRIGMKSRIRLDAYPDLELPGHIYSIGAVPVAGRRANFMKEIKVRLKLDKMDPRVLPDLSASADVVMATALQATLAPVSSVFRDPLGKPFALVRNGDGWDRRPLELGLQNNVSVTVQSGLKPGEVVAAGPPAAEVTKRADGRPSS